jgi:tripartite-type tricarboxylate transporter receptor subunit TctC
MVQNPFEALTGRFPRTLLADLQKPSQILPKAHEAMTNRRCLLQSALGCTAASLALPTVWAQGSSAPPLKLLVGFPPGGGTDAIARLLADKLKDELNRPVVVDNKPGAGGQLAAQALKAAAPDGNTLFLSHDHSISILPQVVKAAGYTADEFLPVTGFASFVNALAVSSNTPATSVAQWVSWVQAGDKTRAVVGVPAPASIPEFVVKMLGERYKLELQPVPYRGSAPMIADMLGNQIPAGTGSVPDFITQHQAGKLRVIAVLGKDRQAVLPDVPSLSELGVSGFEDLPYYGLFAPKGMAQAQVDAVHTAMGKVLAQAAVREQFAKWGLALQHMSSTQLGERVRSYTQSWAGIIKAKGFAPQ